MYEEALRLDETRESATLAPVAREAIRPRLGYLDGVRGIAALFVMFHHALFQVELDSNSRGLSRPEMRAFAFLEHGPVAVVVFIVLSGFCLMLPVVNAPGRAPRRGWPDYFIRRARRILPPYYAALIASIALILAVPGLQQHAGRAWDSAIPALLPAPIIAHLLLIHDFTWQYFTRIDPPMWSIALEWHIYFVYPVLVLVWRRLGIIASLAAGVVLGYLPHKLSHGRLDFSRFHFIGLFACGMAACWVSTSTEQAAVRIRSRLPWGWITAMLTAASVYTVGRQFESVSRFGLPDYVPALAASSLLIYCSYAAKREAANAPILLRLLEAPLFVTVGGFSYSLYLIHYPILAAAYLALLQLTHSPEVRLGALWFVCCPAIVLLAYPFHLAFERPFMSSAKV